MADGASWALPLHIVMWTVLVIGLIATLVVVMLNWT
jgi:hypothetical protein